MKQIIVCYHGNLYKIPYPNELADNYLTNVTIVDPQKGSQNMESKHFFVLHPEIFQLYMSKVVHEHKIPDNFYTFIDRILYYIKVNNLVHDIDIFWYRLINK